MLAIQNVSRHDHKRYHGWAACAFRDKILKKLPPLLFVMTRFVRSKTGLVGVRVQVDRKKQGTYRAFVASWPDPSGRRRTRSLSFTKFGKARAFELAKRARQQGLALLLRSAPKARPLHRSRRKLQA